MSIAATPRPRRADAVRNHSRVVEAAEAVFAERGPDASVDEVAERAGVGRATVYRCFPTKDHLVAGVAVGRLQRFERLAIEALGEPDAGVAFRSLLMTIAEAQAGDRIAIGALRIEGGVGGIDEARAATVAALDKLMRRAKRQGHLRRDATAEDVRVLLSGVGHALRADEQRDPAVWRRYAALVADALAPRA